MSLLNLPTWGNHPARKVHFIRISHIWPVTKLIARVKVYYRCKWPLTVLTILDSNTFTWSNVPPVSPDAGPKGLESRAVIKCFFWEGGGKIENFRPPPDPPVPRITFWKATSNQNTIRVCTGLENPWKSWKTSKWLQIFEYP